MESTKEIVKNLTKQILKGSKKLYSVSKPIIYKEDSAYHIALFAFAYTPGDIPKGEVERPSVWVIADIETGELIEKIDCREDRDFSDAKFEKKCSIRTTKPVNILKAFENETYEMFDKVREGILENGMIDETLYNDYFERVLGNVSEDLERFYTDLSI